MYRAIILGVAVLGLAPWRALAPVHAAVALGGSPKQAPKTGRVVFLECACGAQDDTLHALAEWPAASRPEVYSRLLQVDASHPPSHTVTHHTRV